MIFVFGSNLDGNHAGGAARFAVTAKGAQQRVAEGPTGDAYALPTVGHNYQTMTLAKVHEHIRKFLYFSRRHPDKEFQVTRIGCGIAGFTDGEIAPLFRGAPPNCLFDSVWKPWLGEGYRYWGAQA